MSITYAPGDYVVEVQDQAWQESKKQGLPMLVLRCKVLAGLEFGADGKEMSVPVVFPYLRTTRLVFVQHNEDSMRFALEKLRYAGWDGDDFNSLRLVGRRIRLRCTHGTYEGRPREEWELPLPPREPQPLEDAPDLALRLNALYGRQLKQGAAAAVPAANTAAAAQGSPAAEDDIPF